MLSFISNCFEKRAYLLQESTRSQVVAMQSRSHLRHCRCERAELAWD